MSKIKSSSLILAMLSVTIAIVLVSFRNESSDTVSENPQKAEKSDTVLEVTENVREETLETDTVSSVQSQSISSPSPHSRIGTGQNAAARFFDLPMEQQEEILELSGRHSDSDDDYEVIEVEPGEFSVVKKNGPRVVPVAVMNEDGTVSIHEY